MQTESANNVYISVYMLFLSAGSRHKQFHGFFFFAYGEMTYETISIISKYLLRNDKKLLKNENHYVSIHAVRHVLIFIKEE